MNIAWFSELNKESIDVAGGKGASLGEMYNSKLPIPPGFAVTAQAFKSFIEKTNIKEKIFSLLKDLDVDDTSELQNVSKQIKEIVLKAEMPGDIKSDIIEAYENLNVDKSLFEKAGKQALDIIKAGRDLPYVAVRSSATAEDLPEASFAGQQETFLNIRGNNHLIEAVKHCWASLYTARAIYYRVKNNFPHEKVLISVIVQKQIQSDKAGVIFSVNPVNNNENEILIEAGFGMGEAVVSGSITPDSYVLDKNSLKVKDKKLNTQEWMIVLDPNTKKNFKKTIEPGKQVLNDYEIKKLGELTNMIEDHYKKPQDIEYAIEGPRIYIVQSRPITTLKKVETKEEAKEETADAGPKAVLLKGLAASPGVASGKVKIVKDASELSKVGEGDVLVATMTNPDYVPAMKKASAIVTDEGGLTSHAAIVSREMMIPAIVGTDKATELLKDGDEITVNGSKGEVYRGKIEIKEEKKEVVHAEEGPETITKIKAIMDIPDMAERISELDVDGVGLVRLEIMIAEGGIHPSKFIKENKDEEYTELLFKGIRTIADAFKPRPIWIRLSDLRTDEYRNLEGGHEEEEEDNPMLGNHGIRRSLKDEGILKAEFNAVKKLQDEGYTNIGVMLPFVINLDEVKKAKQIYTETGLTVKFGVMVETPAVCWIIEDICKFGIDFVSFGTNDLTQLTLGLDRNNEDLAHLFSELHPAVLGEMKKVIEVCKKYKVETSICGQSGSKPEMAEFLVKTGIDSISVNPDAVNTIREVVARTERKLLLDFARREAES